MVRITHPTILSSNSLSPSSSPSGPWGTGEVRAPTRTSRRPWFPSASFVNLDVEADEGSAIMDACEFGCTGVWMFGPGSALTVEAVECRVTALLVLPSEPCGTVGPVLAVLSGDSSLEELGMSKALRRKAVFRRTVMSESTIKRNE